MLTAVLSGPPDTRDEVASQLQATGAVIDPDPNRPSAGLPVEHFAWITCAAESLSRQVDPVIAATDWSLRLHWPDQQVAMTVPFLSSSNN